MLEGLGAEATTRGTGEQNCENDLLHRIFDNVVKGTANARFQESNLIR
jgi:hypothetical protein